jgi:hypothetical protein
MSRLHKSFLAFAAANLALGLAACSDTTAPSSLRARSPAFTIGPTADIGPIQVTFGSGADTQFCSLATLIHSYLISDPFAEPTGCAALGFDLQGALADYDPGWTQNLPGSAWIGPTRTSNEYKTAPGIYVFRTQFTVATGVTNPVLNLTLLSDNAVAVYLNGNKVEQQVIADCPVGGPCNWQSPNTFIISDANPAHFNIGGTNTITFLLVDVPNGGTLANNFACLLDPQPTGTRGFTGDLVSTFPDHESPAWTKAFDDAKGTGCENPAGLDFVGTVSWVVPPICDFITFGRLVTTVNGDKVVISGNAGGNAPGGGILGEIQISIGKVDYHVKTIDTYTLTTNQPLLGDSFARVITGKSGTHTIELRLRDNPNPGQGEPTDEGDKVWLKIDGVVVVPLQTPDQGNIQLHLNCRGPGD